jgi:hypothetical protein
MSQPQGQPGYGPPRRRSALPWLLAAGGGIAAVITVVLFITLTGGPDTSTPQAVAEAAATAISDNEDDDMQELACDGVDLMADLSAMATNRAMISGDPTVRVESAEVGKVEAGDANEQDAGAVVMLTIVYTDSSTRPSFLSLDQQNGSWCISRLAPV